MNGHRFTLITICLMLVAWAGPRTAQGAVIEMLNGQKYAGKIVGETETTVTVEVTFEGAGMATTLEKSAIHAITDDKGVRTVLHARPETDAKPVRREPDKKEEPKPPAKPVFDWSCWRGPDHNGISAEKGWRSGWSAGSEPKILWKKELGGGYSGVSVADGRAYTMGNDGTQDTVWCFDAETGAEIWKHSYACGTDRDYPGPRATPTVDDKVVYTFSRKGDLNALDAVSGRVLWQKNPAKEQSAQSPNWDYAGSVYVSGELLFVNVGTAGTALNKHTGAIAWKTGSGKAGYATPVEVVLDGVPALLLFSGKALCGVDLKSGKTLWNHPWETNYDVNAADPIFHDGKVFISTGYKHGSALLAVTARDAAKVYETKAMQNHFNSCVLLDGYLYGFDESTLKCIEFASGAEKWSERGLGKASLVIADGKLIVLSEDGRLVIANAVPTGFVKLGEVAILTKTCWTPPILANGRIYARNNTGSMVCVDMKP
ncbi:MAG: PQQ-binding-like beta-propeller repeat protein [Planctomycetota bacterium]